MGIHIKILKMRVLIVLSCFLAVAFSMPKSGNQLTCDICVDLMTDLDAFITSDTTEDQIVEYVDQLCAAIGQLIDGFEATCHIIVISQLPNLIDDFVNDNLDPVKVCTENFQACP